MSLWSRVASLLLILAIGGQVLGQTAATLNAERANPPDPKFVHVPLPKILRTWEDSTGKFSVKAIIEEIRGDTVYLRKSDGSLAVVPISRLAEIDRQYARSLPTDKVIIGKVVAITDGDTIEVRGDETYKIRLEGIDAPESGQDFGSKAKIALSNKIFGKEVRVEWWSKDRYGRTLGHVICDGVWINKELIDEGIAWHFKEYNKSAILADAELKAREAHAGLWLDKDPISPWAFRATPPLPRGPPTSIAVNSKSNSLADTTTLPKAKTSTPTRIPSAESDTTISRPSGGTSYGTTATGIPTYVGPRGGVYHYSKSGKKVYERKK